MKRFLILISVALYVIAGVAADAAQTRPNIVFILADDWGWRDIGCYGSTFYDTPNLDQLARQGMRFTDAYAACNVCSPTRASIMTGKYPARLHLTDWLPGMPDRPAHKLKSPVIEQHLALEEVTIAEALKQGGYRTGFIGKWHLGGEAYYPDKQGFDVNIGGCKLGHPPSYFSPYKIPTLTDGPKGEYLTDRLTDEAVKFIENNKDRPFFLYLAHYAVHIPLQARPDLLEKYKAKAAKLQPAEQEFQLDHGHRVRQIQNHAIYAAMVESVDESVGRILKELSKLGLETNTVVIFTSDNGGLSASEATPTSNLPLRLGKGWNYEGGIREPLLVKWPRVIKAGTVSHEPVISTDYYPTLLDIAGLPPRAEQHLDAVSFEQVLRGGTRAARPLFWHYPHYSNQGGLPCGAMRDGDWKLIEWYEDGQHELYNLKDDIGERNDLSARYPERVKAMAKQLDAWRKSVGAQMPVVKNLTGESRENGENEKKPK